MKSAITLSLVSEAKGGPFVLRDGLVEGFALAARLGFDAIEIFPGSAAEIEVKNLQSLMSRYELKVAAVGTGAGWVRHKLRLTDPDVAVRRRAQEFICAIIDAAAKLGAPAILGSMQGRYEGNVSREQAVQWLAEALEQFGPRAAGLGMPLLYEFLNRYETNLFNRVAESLDFLTSLRTSNVKLLCDLFHMNIEEVDLAAALRMAGPKVGHIHFADSNRRAVGFGHTDMTAIITGLRDIGYDGYLSAEVDPFPDSETAARKSIESFRQLMSSTPRP